MRRVSIAYLFGMSRDDLRWQVRYALKCSAAVFAALCASAVLFLAFGAAASESYDPVTRSLSQAPLMAPITQGLFLFAACLFAAAVKCLTWARMS